MSSTNYEQIFDHYQKKAQGDAVRNILTRFCRENITLAQLAAFFQDERVSDVLDTLRLSDIGVTAAASTPAVPVTMVMKVAPKRSRRDSEKIAEADKAIIQCLSGEAAVSTADLVYVVSEQVKQVDRQWLQTRLNALQKQRKIVKTGHATWAMSSPSKNTASATPFIIHRAAQ